MRSHNKCGLVIAADIKEQLHYLVSGIRVQVTGGFVRQYQLRVVKQCTRYIHTLLLPSRHLVGHFGTFIFQPYFGEYIFYFFPHQCLVFPPGSFQHKFPGYHKHRGLQ